MRLYNKQIQELEAHIDHLQHRVDQLRDDLRDLEDFTTKTLCCRINDHFKELEDYLNIERVKDKIIYRSKEEK